MTRRRGVGLLAGMLLLVAGCGETEAFEADECESLGGHIIGDPGDGSVGADDCPEGEEFLGRVRFGIEGGICCREKP